MGTERKIRKFMHSSRPSANDGGRFMDEFVRQSSLLPQPSSMRKAEDIGQIEKLETLYRIASAARKANRIDALAVSASAIAVCLLCFTLYMSASVIFPAL